jgi:hypothetical protein
MSKRALALLPVVLGLAFAFACGGPGGAGAPAAAPVASASAAPSASASSAARPPCARMCDVEAWCGRDRAACEKRCGGLERVVAGEVVTAMAACADVPRPAKCDDTTNGLLEACVQKVLASKEGDAKVNVGLFARAFCERAAACGAPAKSTCVDAAVARVQSTLRPATAGLYGAFRPEIVEAIGACLRGPCASLRPEADEAVSRCIDVVLGEGA